MPKQDDLSAGRKFTGYVLVAMVRDARRSTLKDVEGFLGRG
jgi:hypothetical protein